MLPHEPVGCHPGIALKSWKDPAMTGSSKLPFTISEPDGAAAWALERLAPRTSNWAMMKRRKLWVEHTVKTSLAFTFGSSWMDRFGGSSGRSSGPY
jgi:hypothetical protein